MEKNWVLASSNPGKLREFQHALSPILACHGIALVNQPDLGVTAAEEPFDTFTANALAKARHAALATGLPALADDSGLCVAALGGAPGIRSARFFADAILKIDRQAHTAMQAHTALQAQAAIEKFKGLPTDAANLQWLLFLMQGVKDRSAFFSTSIALVRTADDPAPIIATGTWHGQIALAPCGDQGFGYDPIFIDSTTGRAAGQLNLNEKEVLSHRGQALRSLIALIQGSGLVRESAQ
jgi:XTP/dITP diphosphohydrolase